MEGKADFPVAHPDFWVWPWLCENVKSCERWRIYFSDHAALELSMLSVVSEAASEGMLFSAICVSGIFPESASVAELAASRHTANGHVGHGQCSG